MAFCIYCGNEISDASGVCNACGRVVKKNNGESTKERQIIYDGDIHKCPNCGEILNSFVKTCTSCGYELRGNSGSKTLLKFEKEYKSVHSHKMKMELIRNLVIPNSREDILELAFMAAANVDMDAYSFDVNRIEKDNKLQELSNAWMAKLEQAYYKAGVTLIDDPYYDKIKNIYDDKKTELVNAQKKYEEYKIKHDKKKRFQKNQGFIMSIIIVIFCIIVFIIYAIIVG